MQYSDLSARTDAGPLRLLACPDCTYSAGPSSSGVGVGVIV